MNQQEDEQIVRETAAVAEAGAHALLAARHAVRQWAQQRDELVHGTPPQSEQSATPQKRARRGIFARLRSWVHNLTRPKEKATPQQQAPTEQRPAQSRPNTVVQQQNPTPQATPQQAAATGPANPVEQHIAHWASAQASHEYAQHVAASWAKKVEHEAQQLRQMGIDPDRMIQRANQLQTQPTASPAQPTPQAERIARLASQYTLDELNAARALIEQQQPAQENTHVAESTPAATAAPAEKAAPEKQATEPKKTTSRPRNGKNAAGQGEGTDRAVSKPGTDLIGSATPRKRASRAKKTEANAEAPQQLPPQPEAAAAPGAEAAP
ncbi:hypothetical protein [Nocardia sp. NBC_00511]|uniref:hypothetical protein n=1 Tax=Nocardia sp. NBC_00511 TaxID=2903591 RepID=UPI002F9132A5